MFRLLHSYFAFSHKSQRESWRTQTFGEKALLNFQRVAQSHLRAAALCDIPAAALVAKVWNANFCINSFNSKARGVGAKMGAPRFMVM